MIVQIRIYFRWKVLFKLMLLSRRGTYGLLIPVELLLVIPSADCWPHWLLIVIVTTSRICVPYWLLVMVAIIGPRGSYRLLVVIDTS